MTPRTFNSSGAQTVLHKPFLQVCIVITKKVFKLSAFQSLLSAAPAQGHVSDHLPTQEPWFYIHCAKRLESSPWKQDSHIFTLPKKSKVGFQSLWSQNSAPEWSCAKLWQVVDKALACLCPWLRGCSCSCEPRIRRKWSHYFTANRHWESSHEVLYINLPCQKPMLCTTTHFSVLLALRSTLQRNFLKVHHHCQVFTLWRLAQWSLWSGLAALPLKITVLKNWNRAKNSKRGWRLAALAWLP